MRFNATHLLTAAILVAATSSLRAQDAWDSAFKLSAGSISRAQSAGLGNSANYAFALEGSYQVFPKGFLVLEGGYRTLNKNTVQPEGDPLTTQEFSTKGIFGSVLYRYTDFHGYWECLYVQGGLRYHSLKTNMVQEVKASLTDTSPTRTDFAGLETHIVTPLLGVGYRFTDKLSLEFNGFRIKGNGLKLEKGTWVGVEKTSNTFELALGVHL